MSILEYHIDLSNPLRAEISQNQRINESWLVERLIEQSSFTEDDEATIRNRTIQIIEQIRRNVHKRPLIQQFMQRYDLATEEGIMLMCLAEALLRIPDKKTQNELIRDKLSGSMWRAEVNKSQSKLLNWASLGLVVSKKIMGTIDDGYFSKLWRGLISRCGEPVIRQAIYEAIKLLGDQFVIGQNLSQAFQASNLGIKKGYLYSYDMLGEVARTNWDAERYFQAYKKAMIEIKDKNFAQPANPTMLNPGISVKLSALYPRYEITQACFAVPVLIEKLTELAELAMAANINLTVDAEETFRLEMELDIFEAVLKQPQFSNWFGLGLAVQAYQKNSLQIIKWLIDLARQHKRKIPVRLVKGAYWDTEIKLSQQAGLSDYPVFTRKISTDLNYQACAETMLQFPEFIFPQFATHNAYSVSAILYFMEKKFPNQKFPRSNLEFQSLQGMGRELHDWLIEAGYQCRIYAPVGNTQDLLPYLVRRLLENGANSSFVNKIQDLNTPISDLVESPCEILRKLRPISHPKIPLPQAIYGKERENSMGIDFNNFSILSQFESQIAGFQSKKWQAAGSRSNSSEKLKAVSNPANLSETIGRIRETDARAMENVIKQAESAFWKWQNVSVEKRAGYLCNAADLLEKHKVELISLIQREAGRTLINALAEVREAIDYCRYYASLSKESLILENLNGPTGESNSLQLQGRGIFVCISPWNFPLAIFTGQIVAALVAGNTVIAKPAEQTPLVAARMVELLYEAGIPDSVLHLVLGRGETIGQALVSDVRTAGVIFTGSTETARHIAKTLADRSGPIVPFIAETGGINAMIVDSSSLPEQVVADILTSAFDSAGQRCSSLRVLCLQQEIADSVIKMLKGATAELKIGDPRLLTTDVGPVIDEAAKTALLKQVEFLNKNAKLIYQLKLSADCKKGYFFPPHIYEIDQLSLITKEVFGPVLHVYRYSKDELGSVIKAINNFGFGLTFGAHSRINSVIDYLSEKIQAGNIYVNRNMIGAVVGTQPFGGSRLSGTGPKAGGPHYLFRLCSEKTISINTTALGGNATLMSLD